MAVVGVMACFSFQQTGHPLFQYAKFFSVGVEDFPQISHPDRNGVPVTDPTANAGECRYDTTRPQSHISTSYNSPYNEL
jgi:hypothetical protein